MTDEITLKAIRKLKEVLKIMDKDSYGYLSRKDEAYSQIKGAIYLLEMEYDLTEP